MSFAMALRSQQRLRLALSQIGWAWAIVLGLLGLLVLGLLVLGLLFNA
jgi:hypothetical protein